MINGATIVDDRVLIDLSATVPDSYSGGLPYRANQALMCIAGGTAAIPPIFSQDFLQIYDFDENPLTTNYSTIDSVNPMQSTTGGAAGTVDGFESAAYVNSLPAINNSQFAEITLVGIPTVSTMIGVLIRGGLAGSGFYAAMVDGSNLEIRRYTGVETFDILASVAALTGGGSRIKFSIDTGFVLTAYVNDVEVLDTVDPDNLYGTGFPGIVDMGDASTSAKIAQLIIGDFIAGTPGSGTPVDPDLWKEAFPFQDNKFGVVILETDPGVTGYNAGWRTDPINGCLIVNETLAVVNWINGWPVSVYHTVCVTTGVPAPGPFTLSLGGVSGNDVTLDWTAAPFMDTTDEYEVLRDNVSIATVPGNILTYEDTVPSGGTFDYKVVASNPGGSTTATPDPLPVAVVTPGAFSGTAGQLNAANARLNWTLPTSMGILNHFNIHRGGVLRGSVAGNILTFDDAISPPASYTYQITAVNAAGSTIATPDPIPLDVVDVPAAFVVSSPASDPTSVTLDWTDPGNMTASDSFDIYRDAVFVDTVAGNVFTFDDTTIPGDGTYEYQVVATNPAGSTTATPDPLEVIVAAGDPYYANAYVILHFNDAPAASGVVTPNNGPNPLLTFQRNTVGDTSATEFQWGPRSLHGPGGGASGVFTGATWAELGFGTGDFTIELWARFDNANATQNIICWKNSLGTALYGINPGVLHVYSDGEIMNSTTGILLTTTWQFIAYSRTSGVGELYVDGVRVATAADTTDYGATGTMYIGATVAGVNSFAGYIDDVRVTKGVGRYTGTTCPVPTGPFPDS